VCIFRSLCLKTSKMTQDEDTRSVHTSLDSSCLDRSASLTNRKTKKNGYEESAIYKDTQDCGHLSRCPCRRHWPDIYAGLLERLRMGMGRCRRTSWHWHRDV